jgi:hypothetical protein
MDNFIDDFIRKNLPQFKKYSNYISENDWTKTKPYLSKKKKKEANTEELKEIEYKQLFSELVFRKEEADVQFKLSKVLAQKLTYFCSEASSDAHLQKYKNFVKEGIEILKIHINRCEEYNEAVDIQEIPNHELKKSEIAFHNDLFKYTADLQKHIRDCNFREDLEEYDSAKIEFFNKKKAPFITRELLSLVREDVKEKVEKIPVDWSLRTSKEMYINMNPKDVPKWNYKKHFFEQDPVVLQFWAEEYNKICHGVTIGGYFIHPWLYFHLNFFRTPIPQKDGTEPNIQPDLRDNEWFLAENLKKCINPENEAYYSKAILMYGTRRFGKALRNDQHLYYTDGSIRPIGLAKVGDEIFGSDGRPTNILGVYPQGKVNLYELELSDGRKSICCDEHLWTVYDYQAKKYKTLPLKEIMADGWMYNRQRQGGKKQTIYKYFLPINKAVDYTLANKMPVDPYYLGLWLGDGTKRTTSVTTADKEIEDFLINYANEVGLRIREEVVDGCKTIHLVNKKGADNKIFNILRELKVIVEKHIPYLYKVASKQDRMALLQGLMDTDGTINAGGSDISFTSASKVLAYDVLELARSLGIHAKIEHKVGNYTKKDGNLNTFYKVLMYTNKPVFRLSRKLQRIDSYNVNRVGKIERVPIINIKQVESDFATCIRVDNDNKEFLTNDFIVTHNSVILASLAHWRTITKFNSFGSVIGGSSSDISALTSKIKTSMSFIDEPLRLDVIKQEWDNGETTFGIKEDAQTPRIFSTLIVQNLESGAKKSSQKTAGLAPSVSIYDEIGKYNFLKSYLAALPSFKTPYGFKCVTVLAGTGGEADLSKDAVDVLSSPEAYDLLPMDWDLLQNKIDPEHVSWKQRKFATFFPGQMAYEEGFIKKKVKFSDFLEVTDDELAKIDMHVTDWEKNTKMLLNKIDEARKIGGSKGKLLEQQRRVQYPIDPEDCFMSTEDNIFPAVEAQNRKNFLQETGDTGKKVILFEKEGEVKYEFSDKPLADYPFSGGFIDAPCIMYEELPETRPVDHLYLAGFDDYKQEESGTDSVGGFFIYKVNIGSDEWSGRIVFSIASRPDPHAKLYKQMFLAMKAYNAKCFMENADMGFKEYLDRLRVTENFLVESFDFKADIGAIKSTGKRRYGWTPTPENIRFLKNLVRNYVNKEHPKIINGEEVMVLGVDLINDIGLLEEMIYYKPDNNVDRITAFMSCLGYEYYAFANWLLPTADKLVRKEEKPKPKQQKTLATAMFGNRRSLKHF